MSYPMVTKNALGRSTVKIVKNKIYLNDIHDSPCIICLEGRRSNEKYTRHHISYDPQVIAWVHEECHLAVHENDIKEFIYYTPKEVRRFRQVKVDYNKYKTELIPDSFRDDPYIY